MKFIEILWAVMAAVVAFGAVLYLYALLKHKDSAPVRHVRRIKIAIAAVTALLSIGLGWASMVALVYEYTLFFVAAVIFLFVYGLARVLIRAVDPSE